MINKEKAKDFVLSVIEQVYDGYTDIVLSEKEAKYLREGLQNGRNKSELKFIRGALEKAIPKEVLPDNEYYEGICPNCGVHFLDRTTNYCGNCGQAIDWGDSGGN